MSAIRVDKGVAVAMKEGETDSGDSYLVKKGPHGFFAAVIDGLGHGAEAAAATHIATRALEGEIGGDIRAMLNRCHKALYGTRGAVASFLELRESDRSLTWAGIGNVQGMLFRANPEVSPETEPLIPQPGILGNAYPFAIRPAKTLLKERDTIIVTTDGIRSFSFSDHWRAAPAQKIADDILAGYGKGDDDALVLVLRCLGIPA